MISLLEAQNSAEKQVQSAITPLREKSFVIDDNEVEVISFIKENKLPPEQIEKICNLKMGEQLMISQSRFLIRQK